MRKITWVFLAILSFQAKPLAQTINQQRLDSVVTAYEKLGYAGNVLIAYKNKVVYQKAYGIANRQTGARVTPATLFKTESLGKLLTGALVLRLVEKKLIDLNAPINTYLSDTVYALPLMQKVTVHHLLTHTSGYEPTPQPTASSKRMNNVRLSFPEPGSKALYSNIGYKVLGEIIAQVTGKSYDENLWEHILKPAGVKNYYPTPIYDQSNNIALPYKFVSEKNCILVKENMVGNAGPDGGWVTTIEDLFKLYKAYYNNRFFSANTWEVIRTANHTITPQPVKNEIFTYGLNWLPSGLVGDHMIYGHSGGGLCFSSALYFEPQTGFAVITLSNTYQPSRIPVANFFNVLNNRALIPIDFSNEYQLMSLIDRNSLEDFKLNHQQYFKQVLGDKKPDRGLFTKLIDNYTDLKAYAAIFPVVEVAETYFPDSKALWHYFKADAHFNSKAFPQAKSEIEQALQAVGENNPTVKRYIDELASKLAQTSY